MHEEPNVEPEQSALEATAFIHLGRLNDANRALIQTESICARNFSAQCGAVWRARGLLALNRAQFGAAKQSYLNALDIARTHQDKMLEGTCLLNLATTLSNQEHHDEALELYESAYRVATEIQAQDLAQSAISGEAWEYYSLGNSDKAFDLFTDAERRAASLGDTDSQAQTLTLAALVYANAGEFSSAEADDRRAIQLAMNMHRKDKIINASEDLAQVYIDEGRPDDADRSADETLALSQQANDRPDILYCYMLQGEAAALRHDWPRAESLLHEVAAAPESQQRMKWTAVHTLATIYEAQGQTAAAEQAYKAALALVEGARANLHQEISQLTFRNNATRIYDDYIHFLVAQGRSDKALEAADWSRARTLQQGLGLIAKDASLTPPRLRFREIARQTDTTLLFYWMGEKQSYLWAISPAKTDLVVLPTKGEIVARIERYRRTLLALKDPLRASGSANGGQSGSGDQDGRALYEMLVAPVSGAMSPGRPVVLFTDGEMAELNFETLIAGSPTPHYWIDDATVSSAPSIHLFAAKSRSASVPRDRLLLLGDSVAVDPSLPRLPMAALEVQKVKANFRPSDTAVFVGPEATPRSYLASRPEQFSYIHFAAHGTASRTDPLESAVVLSQSKDDRGRTGEFPDGDPGEVSGGDSYKLYAREILQHPIAARLVTVSACNSSGSASIAGEGMVGLSWAFLRAGAHHTIGALWDVSDASTPELMDRLYAGLKRNEPPAAALRNAKLSLLHSGGNFSRPFYWAPFQLYSGR